MRAILPLLLVALLGLGILPARAEESAEASAANKLERVLTDDQRAAVTQAVAACWRKPASYPAGATVTLLVIADGNDTVMDATVVPEDVARVDTPALRSFAISALRAMTDPHCAHLAVSHSRLGQPWLFRLRFAG